MMKFVLKKPCQQLKLAAPTALHSAFPKPFRRLECCLAPSQQSSPQAICTVSSPSSMLSQRSFPKLFPRLHPVEHPVSLPPSEVSPSYFPKLFPRLHPVEHPVSLPPSAVFRLFYLFAHLDLLSSEAFSFLIFFLLLFSDSSRLCFSSVHVVGSLTSKLTSVNVYVYRTKYLFKYTYFPNSDSSGLLTLKPEGLAGVPVPVVSR